MATLPSADRYTHRQRFLRDNSFEQSFSRVIGSGGSNSSASAERSSGVYEQTRRLYESSDGVKESRARLPGGSEYLLGKWKPVAQNGNELFARIVTNSKFQQPTFV